MRGWKPIVTLIVLLAMQPAAADVYRWVDEHGQVHYEDQPRDSRTRKLAPSRDAGDAARTQQQRMEKTRRLLDAYDKERQKERDAAAERRKQAQERKRKCLTARDELRSMTESNAIYRLNDAGERVYYNESQREALLAGYRKAIKKYCK